LPTIPEQQFAAHDDELLSPSRIGQAKE